AADSASTLAAGIIGIPGIPSGAAPQQQVAMNVYNNANKIANLYKGKPIGCVAYGSGSIGSASISTLLKDFRHRISEDSAYFDINRYSMEDLAKLLAEFLTSECQKLSPLEPRPTLG